MSRRFRIALQVTGGLLLLIFCFPAWHTTGWGWDSSGKYFYLENARNRWGLLWHPVGDYINAGGNTVHWLGQSIAWDLMALELAIIAVMAGLVFVSMKDKE